MTYRYVNTFWIPVTAWLRESGPITETKHTTTPIYPTEIFSQRLLKRLPHIFILADMKDEVRFKSASHTLQCFALINASIKSMHGCSLFLVRGSRELSKRLQQRTWILQGSYS